MAIPSLLPLLLAAAVAAASTPAPTPAPPSPAPAGAPAGAPLEAPTLRLPATVRPVAGALELRVDPASPRFSGTARYRVAVGEPSPVVWMHAEGLEVESASVAGRPARAVTAPGGFLGLVLDGPVPAGEVEVVVAFSGSVDRERSRGLYAVEDGGAWYAYTFFEPIDARRAFPCFDEPSAKIPWTVTLVVPAADVALANAPVARESVEGEWRRVSFAETRPLPSYLVAFVVGPFDVIPGGVGGAARVPIRFVVPRGRSDDLRFARAVTPRILDALEATVGLPYPYEKCDVAVVPRYWGTMEHPGLVALGQPLALIPPREETRARREAYASIAIHELAHHWYGDLVTLAWWDDIWLNESFGTWEDAHATEVLEPAWKVLAAQRAHRRDAALAADALPSARRLREPVRSSHEIEGAFDAEITYYKGATVIGSYETFLGDGAWRAVVREYLAARAHGTATTGDFLAVLSERAGARVAESLRGFLDQPGVPLVRAEARCGDDAAVVRIRQERFLADGSRDPAARWTLPLCLRSGRDGASTTTCSLVEGPEAELPLPACPDWIWPNASGAGHWISLVPGTRPAALLPHLGPPEALALATDAVLLARRGDLPVGDALALVAPLARSPDPLAVEASIRVARLVDSRRLPDRDLPAWRALVRRTWGPRARALGWTPRPDDDEDTRMLRALLVPLVAGDGEDPALDAAARRIADSFLAHRASVPAEAAWPALAVAARRGDRALFDRIAGAADRAADRAEKGQLLALLGAFQDPALARKALARVTAPGADLRDTRFLLQASLGGRRTSAIAWAFLRDGWDGIVPRMRADEAGWLVSAAAREACDPERRAEVAAFLGPRVQPIDGAPGALRTGLDEADACIAARARNEAAIRRFLAGR